MNAPTLTAIKALLASDGTVPKEQRLAVLDACRETPAAEEKWVSPKAAADHFEVSPRTIHRWVEAGLFGETKKINRSVLRLNLNSFVPHEAERWKPKTGETEE